MSNDETIFSNRTNQDIDEALAWLDGLAGNTRIGKRPNEVTKRSEVAVDQYNLPTWLQMDIRIEPPKPVAKVDTTIDDENLSWLDNLNTNVTGSSSIEEPPTMNWKDTDIHAASEQIRAVQREVREATNALEIEDEDTNVTQMSKQERLSVVSMPDLELETEPTQAPPPTVEDETEKLERPLVDEWVREGASDISDLLASQDEAGAELDVHEEGTEIVPPDVDDIYFDISDQAIADWLNSADHGTEIVLPTRDLPAFEFDGFPELDAIISAEVERDEPTDIILPDTPKPTIIPRPLPELNSREVILPQFVPAIEADPVQEDTEIVLPNVEPDISETLSQIDHDEVTKTVLPMVVPVPEMEGTHFSVPKQPDAAIHEDATELVLPSADPIPEMEGTHFSVPKQPVADEAIYEDATELVLPTSDIAATVDEVLHEDVTEIVLPAANPVPEMEGTHFSVPKKPDAVEMLNQMIDEAIHEDATELVLPSADPIPEMEGTHFSVPKQPDADEAIHEDAIELVLPTSDITATIDEVLHEDATEIVLPTADPIPEMEGTHFSVPKQRVAAEVIHEDETELVLPSADPIPEMEGTHFSVPQLPTSPSQIDDEGTNVIPYDMKEITDEMLAEARGKKPTAVSEEDRLDVSYKSDYPAGTLPPEIPSLDDDHPTYLEMHRESTQVVPYDLAEATDEMLAEAAADGLNEAADEMSIVVKSAQTVEAFDAIFDEPTNFSSPELNNLPDLPEIAEMLGEAGLHDAVETVEKDEFVPAKIEWLDAVAAPPPALDAEPATSERIFDDSDETPTAPRDVAAILAALEESSAAEVTDDSDDTPSLPPDVAEILAELERAPSADEIANQSDSDGLGLWDAPIPRDPLELAALSAPTIIANVPISERWRQVKSPRGRDSAEAEALDLLDSAVEDDTPSILDTMHADVVRDNVLTPEQLADLTEPVDYMSQDDDTDKLDLTEPVDYTPREPDFTDIDRLADGIPDDPDEAIAWLEKMAKQGGHSYTPPIKSPAVPKEEPERAHDAPHFLEMSTIEDEGTVVSTGATMESFMRQLEEAMDEDPNRSAESSKPLSTDPLPEELSDALAWLEDLVTGSENPLDETTVELNEADVQALLRQAVPRPALPESEEKASPAPELPQAVRAAPPSNALPETDPEGGELDEALAWLEAFANEESSLILPNAPAEPVTETIMGQPVRPYHEVRLRAENALALGDHKQVAREYTGLIENEKSAALDVVIEDMSRITRQVANSPLLYRVLGDAYAKQLNFEMAAQAYRNGLDVL